MNKDLTLEELYNHRCSCGKLLSEHKVNTSSTTQHWETLKMYYDLKTCNIENRKIMSIPNGWTEMRTYYFCQ
jgi:hypothetical protein